jgi:hypothetical protein
VALLSSTKKRLSRAMAQLVWGSMPDKITIGFGLKTDSDTRHRFQNRHRWSRSLLIFKPKPTVIKDAPHGPAVLPLTTTGALLPPTRQLYLKKLKKTTTTARVYKMALDREPFNGQI